MFLNFQLQQKEQEKQTLKPVIFGLIDLYDRLAAGLEQKPPEQNMFFSLFHDRRHERWFEAHQEGQKMILGRVLDLLNLCEVSVFEVTGMIFNPAKMKAVQFKTDSDRKNGLVLYECRKGFLWGSRVIRSAEVIVNKIQE
jgi:molecular chaperone GrpE (heat shock protein)